MKTLILLLLIGLGVNGYGQTPTVKYKGERVWLENGKDTVLQRWELRLDTSYIHGDTLTQVWDSVGVKSEATYLDTNKKSKIFITMKFKITEVFYIRSRLQLLSRTILNDRISLSHN